MKRDSLKDIKATRVYRVGPDDSESEARTMPAWLRNVAKLGLRKDEPGYTGPGNLRFWACRPLKKPGRFGRTYEMVYCVDWRAEFPTTVAVGYGGSKELIVELATKEEALALYAALQPMKATQLKEQHTHA